MQKRVERGTEEKLMEEVLKHEKIGLSKTTKLKSKNRREEERRR